MIVLADEVPVDLGQHLHMVVDPAKTLLPVRAGDPAILIFGFEVTSARRD
jgi:hypothetical protein